MGKNAVFTALRLIKFKPEFNLVKILSGRIRLGKFYKILLWERENEILNRVF